MVKQKIQDASKHVDDIKTGASELANALNQAGQTKLAADAQAMYGLAVNAESNLGDAITTLDAAVADLNSVSLNLDTPAES